MSIEPSHPSDTCAVTSDSSDTDHSPDPNELIINSIPLQFPKQIQQPIQRINPVISHSFVMGKQSDFRCYFSTNQQRRFMEEIHSPSSSWIISYFGPTHKFKGKILLETSRPEPMIPSHPNQTGRWRECRMRRYCRDELDIQVHRFSEYFDISSDAKRMLMENAGGNSHISEALSFEILRLQFGAELIKTECEIKYWWPHWKMTDYMIRINGKKFGVSVTRAMKLTEKQIFSAEDAERLLSKKMQCINESTEGVLLNDQWDKQILHIFAMNNATERTLRTAYRKLKIQRRDLVNDTVVLVTVTNNTDRRHSLDEYYGLWGRCDWIYFNIFP